MSPLYSKQVFRLGKFGTNCNLIMQQSLDQMAATLKAFGSVPDPIAMKLNTLPR